MQTALQSYNGNVNPTQILAGLNRDGNFHFLSEAEAVNRDLAVALNRDVGFSKRSRSARTAASRSSLGNRWFVSEDDAWRLGALGLVLVRQHLAQP